MWRWRNRPLIGLVAGPRSCDWAAVFRRWPRNALSSTELRSSLLNDRSLRVDANDQLLYVEPSIELGDQAEIEPDPLAPTIDPSAAFTLHSRPGSRRVIYLDFDGHMVSGTAWNDKTAGPCFADPYDTDGVPATFSDAELTAIVGVWARVAEDFAPMDVNVTTVDPGPAAITRSSPSDSRYGTRVLVTRSTTPCSNGLTLYSSLCSGGCGGLAYVGVFDRSSNHGSYQPAFVFQNGSVAARRTLPKPAPMRRDTLSGSATTAAPGRPLLPRARKLGTDHGCRLLPADHPMEQRRVQRSHSDPG